MKRLLAVLVAAALGAGCRLDRVRASAQEPWPERLSGWGLFRGDGATLEPSPGVLPYEVATPLFSDYAEKYRTVWMPPGTSARYDADGAFELPAGTILSKTFMYPRGGTATSRTPGPAGNADRSHRLVETRLLVRGERGWVALPYLWNDEGTEARLEIVGAIVPVEAPHGPGPARAIRYVVPNVNQCQGCHEQDKTLVPIGITARSLNASHDDGSGRGPENQLARWARQGYLTGAPDPEQAPRLARWDPRQGHGVSGGDLEANARAYLDANCAHCHSPKGPGASAGIDLRSHVTEPRLLGVCKPPVAAGRGAGPGLAFDIVPGQPEASILTYRLRSTDPGVMMPELGRTLAHEEALQLLEAWIRSLDGRCDAP